jgi:hypothetical protein
MTRWLLLAFVVTALSLSGCQLGRFSLAVNKDYRVPYPTLDVLPNQWEPELDESE